MPRVLDIGMEKDNAKYFTISNILMPSIIHASLNLIFKSLSQLILDKWELGVEVHKHCYCPGLRARELGPSCCLNCLRLFHQKDG